MRKAFLAGVLAVAVLTAAGCEESRAFGEVTRIVVASNPDLWTEVQDSVQSVLEPTVFTVRRERTFTLTHQDPTEEAWNRLRQFRQELLIGTANDPWVAEALEERESDEELSPPEIVQVYDVWARNQLVTILLLPEGGGAEDVYPMLGQLHELMDEQFREYVQGRMFVSGRDTALANELMEERGFRLAVPNVYQQNVEDSVFIFRNDNPSPSELIRQVAVTWRSPIPESIEDVDLLEWRSEVANEHYSYPQVHDTTQVFRRAGEFQDLSMREVQAIWANPPDDAFPAGGPFILRAVECPDDDRLYLLDAWLYAPGEDKYEYMIQLETIVDSFRCR